MRVIRNASVDDWENRQDAVRAWVGSRRSSAGEILRRAMEEARATIERMGKLL